MAISHPAGELIEDREVAKLDDDRLGHRDVVDQLSQLVMSAPTPSNIALYGAWGSGKSGVGKLLEADLAGRSGVRFARFDAFKYAQNPLRRNFVSVVANALDQTGSKYHEDLYRARVDTDFHVPFTKVARLLLIFALIAFICGIVVLALTAGFAIFHGGDIWASILSILSSAVPASLVPATLLTAVIALVGRTFVQEKRVDRADSDEEFERLFRQLVKDSGADRLVVFVDEIDRCAPGDVVETLNTVRTFLGVDKCIFVVAADPQVIEQALADGSSHATPADELNPYYSAGSGYLDKVFQYQVTLPPLMPQSVTSFAVELVRNRPGVWQTIDVSVVASILIPTHVRSPRRVKNLLNSFAMAYRLAEARHASGLLDIDVANEVDELARIVCLRVEFPLFARDMVSDANLPEYVLRLHEAGAEDERAKVWGEFPYVTTQTRRIASGYAGRTRQVDKLLLEPEGSEQDEEAARNVTEMHGQQLLDYLSRTRLVTGPTRALIHLQNTGPLFGLTSTVAEQLERDAQNGALAAIRTLYEELDDRERLAALALLVQQAHVAIGYESRNVGQAILTAIGSRELSTDSAESCAMVIAGLVAKYPEILDKNTVAGAWTLALACRRTEALALGKRVLNSELAADDDEFFSLLLRRSAAAKEMDQARFGEILMSRLLVDDPAIHFEELVDLPSEDLAAVLSILDGTLPVPLAAAIDSSAAWVKRKSEQSASAAATAAQTAVALRSSPVAAATDEEDDDDDPPLDPSRLLDEMASLVSRLERRDGERVLSILLRVGRQATRDRIEGLLSDLGPVQDPDLALALLRATALRTIGRWAIWLAAVGPTELSSTEGRDLIRALVAKLQERGRAPGAIADEVRAASEAVEPLLLALDETGLAAVRELAADVGQPVQTEDDIPTHQETYAVALAFAAAGLCLKIDVLNDEARSLTATMLTELDDVQEADVPLAQYVAEGVKNVLQVQIDTDVEDELLEAISECNWLSESDHDHLLAVATALAHVDAAQHSIVSPSAAKVLSYRTEMTATKYSDLVRFWLMGTDEELSDVRPVIDAFVRLDPVPDLILAAIANWRTRSGELEQRTLLASYLDGSPQASVSDRVLLALGLRDLGDEHVAEILIARYKAATTNPKRLEVLRLWETARIKDPTARTALIRHVLVPIFKQGVTAVEPALGYLLRLADPLDRSTKRSLGEAVVQGTSDHDRLQERAQATLHQLGYKVKRRGLLGLRKEVDFTE